MYASLHNCSRDFNVNQCITQEMEGGGEEARVEADVFDKEAEQSMTNDEKIGGCEGCSLA